MATPSRLLLPATTVATIIPPNSGLPSFCGNEFRAFGPAVQPGRVRSAERLTRDPRRDALERILARRRIGSDMDPSERAARIGDAGALLQRKVGGIEIMIGAGVDH